MIYIDMLRKWLDDTPDAAVCTCGDFYICEHHGETLRSTLPAVLDALEQAHILAEEVRGMSEDSKALRKAAKELALQNMSMKLKFGVVDDAVLHPLMKKLRAAVELADAVDLHEESLDNAKKVGIRRVGAWAHANDQNKTRLEALDKYRKAKEGSNDD